jgi:syntaxin 8
LDDVLGVVQATRFEAENFGAEARLQNKMLDNLNNDIDRTEQNMVRVEGKMKNLIKASSMCRLWSILLLEFLLLLVLIYKSF